MKYILNAAEYTEMTASLGFDFGYLEGVDYFVDEEFIDRLESNGVDINAACLAVPSIAATRQTRFPTNKEYEFYNYVYESEHNHKCPPKGTSFKIAMEGRLHPFRTFVGGVLTKIVYYAVYDGSTFANPVVEEEFNYIRDGSNFATKRDDIISWFFKDGSKSIDTKTLEKFYTGDEAVRESKRRRQNIIDNLQMPIIGLIIQTSLVDQGTAISWGSAFMGEYLPAMSDWISTPANYAFQNKLATELVGTTAYPWLFNDIGGGTTIKDYLLGQINY